MVLVLRKSLLYVTVFLPLSVTLVRLISEFAMRLFQDNT